MNTYTLLTFCLLAHTSLYTMKRSTQLTPQERAQKELELERRMAAMRSEQEQRIDMYASQQNPADAVRTDGHLGQTRYTMANSEHPTEHDFEQFLSEQHADFTHRHAREQAAQYEPLVQHECDDALQREREFEARMMAMRLEQARRVSHPAQHESTQRSATHTQRTVEVPGGGTTELHTVDFGSEGIPLEEFMSCFKPRNPAPSTTPKKKSPVMIMNTCSAEMSREFVQEGYLKHVYCDGLICFYLPGHENSIDAYHRIHINMNNQFRTSDSDN